MTEAQKREIAQKNVLALALVGDAVLTLQTRAQLVNTTNEKVSKLHDITSKTINAKSQSILYNEIKSTFNEIEADIANRARNAKHHTIPKSCTRAEYMDATALEAVTGYNFLIENTERLNNLFTFLTSFYKGGARQGAGVLGGQT